MKNTVIAAVMMWSTHCLFGQSTSDLMLSGGLDLIKTDTTGVFEKAQMGLEANYFVVRHFSVGLGGEIWTDQKSSFMMGARWYANDNVFLRFRGFIGANDAAIGGGYSKALTEYLRLEGMGDFFISSTEFGVRIGLSYVIKN